MTTRPASPRRPRQGPAENGALAASTASQAAMDGSGRCVDVGAVSEQQQAPQTLILDGYPDQAQQDLLGPNRGSRRWGVAEERARIQADTAIAARRQGIKPVPPPVQVTYRFVVPDRGRRDWDNYALICKPVQDGLVKAGVLVGDHYAVLTASVVFHVEKGARRLEIVLEPLSAPQRAAANEQGEGG